MEKNKENLAWREGWLSSAVRLQSPNFSPRPEGVAVDLIVIHSISLPPGVYGNSYIEDLFYNQLDPLVHPYFEKIKDLEVSSHFVIKRDGMLLQFVSCDDSAWHAGKSHWRGRDRCNEFSIGIELEGLEGDVFDPAQYTRLVSLIASIVDQYPVSYLAGHDEIAPGRKFDPGKGFDWGRLETNLR